MPTHPIRTSKYCLAIASTENLSAALFKKHRVRGIFERLFYGTSHLFTVPYTRKHSITALLQYLCGAAGTICGHYSSSASKGLDKNIGQTFEARGQCQYRGIGNKRQRVFDKTGQGHNVSNAQLLCQRFQNKALRAFSQNYQPNFPIPSNYIECSQQGEEIFFRI